MAGKFINTEQKLTVDSLVEGFMNKLDNPYYTFTDKKATITTYYNINKAKTTLDESLKIEYSRLGTDSPLRFNRIHNMFIYGLERINAQLEMGDFGLASSAIEGEAYILPNTIEPLPGDYFSIDYLKDTLLFRVNDVSCDTIENDNNFWRISYSLDRPDDKDIQDQIIDEFEMIVDNVGTQFKSIIRQNDYNFIENVEEVLSKLKRYYNQLFYNTRVQTYTYTNKGKNFYDPYMIEFIIKNKLMVTDKNTFTFVTHQTNLSSKFEIIYDRTMFRWLEKPDLKVKNYPLHNAQAVCIDDIMSVFDSRPEDYFQVRYVDSGSIVHYNDYILKCFGDEFILNLFENKRFEGEDYRNIIIGYFYNEKLNGDSLNIINTVDFDNNMELFYNIPVLIFILEKYIIKLLKTYK